MIHRRLTPLMIMLLAGCAVGPDYQPPASQTPTHWNDPGDSGVKSKTASTATNPRWWKTFGSPQLDRARDRGKFIPAADGIAYCRGARTD